jgi:hypothetical protein
MLVKDAVSKYGIDVLAHLDREVSVPMVTSAACQGDVSILRVTKQPASTPVPAAGYPVVRGENGGNTHSLHGDGPVFYDGVPERDGSLLLGRLTVPEGSAAVLAHPEHGFLAVAPGTYDIGRQREYAGEWRMVAD